MRLHSLMSEQIVAAGSYGTSGLSKWLQENVITLIVLILGITVLWAARGGNISKGITTVAGLILGLAVLGLASGTNATDMANFVVSLFRA